MERVAFLIEPEGLRLGALLNPETLVIRRTAGVRPRRVGNRNENVTPAEALQCADGFMNVVILNPDQYEKFCRVLGDEGLVTEGRFATNAARIENHAAFKARVEAALSKRNVKDWVERMVAAGLAAGPIYEFDQVFEDPQVKHTGMVREVEQPGLGTVRMLGFPFAVGGATALFSERSTAEKMFEVINRYRPTILTTVPTMINSMLNVPGASAEDVSSLRFCYSAGEALPKELYERWMNAFGVDICDGIGSAEMFHIYITNRPGDIKPGSLGRIVEGYEAKIVDADNNEVATGETEHGKATRAWVEAGCEPEDMPGAA